MTTIRKLMRAVSRLWHGNPNKQENTTKLFYDVLKEYVKYYTTVNTLSEETAGHYQTRQNNIHLFLASKQLVQIHIDEVKIRHMEDLRAWLFMNLKTCSKRTASRHIDLCKAVIKYAVQEEYILNDCLSPIKGQRDKKKDPIYLTRKELTGLLNHQFANDVYNVIAKIFAFQCFTGLSYKELYSYKLIWFDTQTINGVEVKGRWWIDSLRTKNDVAEYSYLFDEAKEIHDFFNGQIPLISNQTYNRILKEIAEIRKISKKLTTHVGRKTHSTLLDEIYAISTETRARQLRHSEQINESTYTAKSHRRTGVEFERVGIEGRMFPAA